MKKNWFLRIGLIALVLAIATTCLVGGTFAKYTTTVSGEDTVQVARFDFAATDGAGTAYASAKSINLFESNATAATDTVAADADGVGIMLAPGVSGIFYIVFDNTTTDVDVTLDTGVAETRNFATAVTGTGLDTSTAFISFKAAYAVNSTAGTAVSAAKTAALTALTAETTPGTPDLGYYKSGAISRLSLADMSTQLSAFIKPIILQKGSAGVIAVQYEWVDGNDSEDSAIAAAIEDGTVTITSTVTIIASQIVAEAAPGYTAATTLGVVA